MVATLEEVAMKQSTFAVLGVVGLLVAPAVSGGELDLLPIGDPGRSYQLGSTPEGTFYDCHNGEVLTLTQLAAELVQARVVLIGEEHTSMDQKLFHGRLLEEMAGLGSDLILGMEFFLRSDREVLERWSQGEIDTETLLREVGWYDRGGYRFAYYQPIMEVARRRGIPVVGLNVERDIPRAVNRGGLDGLDEQQRLEVGEIETGGSPEHRYLIGRYFGETVAMLPPGWFDNMYSAQCLWDVVMARSILDNLRPNATMVVIVGSGHVAYDVGIARRIHDELESAGRPDMKVATFCPVTAPPPDPEGDTRGHPMGDHGKGLERDPGKPAQFVRSLADYVGAFAATGGIEAYPSIGLRLDEADDGIPVVSMVWPDTPASEVGFEAGDRLLDFNGVTPTDLSDLRWRLAATEWGERAGFLIRRGEEVVEVALLLYPDVDLSEEDTAPGYTRQEAVPFNPASSKPVVADSSAQDGRRYALISRDSKPIRVEVLVGDVLEEVHELDASGRVMRSLHRTPLADGAVEVLWVRGPDGEVTAATRISRAGSSIVGE
jgi:uncharacterized iron-regulated protein